MPFHAGNPGSNPGGDANYIGELGVILIPFFVRIAFCATASLATCSCTVVFLILPFYATLQSIIVIAKNEKGRAI